MTTAEAIEIYKHEMQVEEVDVFEFEEWLWDYEFEQD